MTCRPAVGDLSRLFRASVFPADRYELYAEASRGGAPEAVLDALHRLPPGRVFDSFDEVWSVLGNDSEVQAHITRPGPSAPEEASSRP